MTPPRRRTSPGPGRRGRHAAAAHGAGERGFTLIETLVVMALLGMVGALIVSRGPQRSATLELKGVAGEVAQGLRLARTQAILQNKPVAFVVDLAGRSFRVGQTAPRALPQGIDVSVVAVADAAAGREAGIVFAPDGSSTGGRVELAQGERRLQVGVNWLTGRVSVANGP